MEDNIDVVKELEIKNQELLNNSNIIGIENTMESLLLFYCKRMNNSNKDEKSYCDNVAQEVINKINSLLDNKDDVTHQEKVSALVNAFFDIFKNEVNNIVSKRLEIIKSNIQKVDAVNYREILSEEADIIARQVADFYQANIHMLIDEIEDSITRYQLDFQYYLSNTVYLKLINTLKDHMMYSTILINSKHDENMAIFQRINEKTLK